MSKTQLALLGGSPIRKRPFATPKTIGTEEKQAVNEVLDSGNLSQFIGAWGDDFFGGPRVQRLEREWEEYFGVKHAVSMNSATSCLYAAVAATGIGPGDEVIVSPYTMSASAVGVLLYGATPVFADIDPRTYCISAETIRKVISPRTKAILAVDIFGHPADWDAINALAQEHGLYVIEDSAQAPAARYKGRWAGCLADMGVFSLNYHKTIHSGEGGVAVTNDDELADRLRLVRNHAEAVVKAKGTRNLTNLIGFNYRMTEIEAAIAAEQLKKLERLTTPRIEHAAYLDERLRNLPGLTAPYVQPDCRHVYYLYSVQFDAATVGISRQQFIDAVRAEGVPLAPGYVEPLYLQPIYQEQAFHFGPKCHEYQGNVSYQRGICPTTESMHFERLFYTNLIHAGLSRDDVKDVADAIEKVVTSAASLRRADLRQAG